MCTFSAEEVAALQAGGNEVRRTKKMKCAILLSIAALLNPSFSLEQRFWTTYCATWTPSGLTRPTDRHPERSKEWIDAIYVMKRFHRDAPTRRAPEIDAPSAAGSGISVEGGNLPAIDGEIAVLSLEGVLGKGMPKLQVLIPGEAKNPSESRSPSGTSEQALCSSRSTKTQTKTQTLSPKLEQKVPVQEEALVTPIYDTGAVSAIPWDPFGTPEDLGGGAVVTSGAASQIRASEFSAPVVADSKSPIKETRSVAAHVPAARIPTEDSWTAFGVSSSSIDCNGVGAYHEADNQSQLPRVALEASISEAMTNPALSSAPAESVVLGHTNGWQAFEANGTAQPHTDTRPASLSKENAVVSPPQDQPQMQPPKMSDGRREVPLASKTYNNYIFIIPAVLIYCCHVQPLNRATISLFYFSVQDVFYPEFAKIRATGVLPTGQLVPGMLPQQYSITPSPGTTPSRYGISGMPLPSPTAGHFFSGAPSPSPGLQGSVDHGASIPTGWHPAHHQASTKSFATSAVVSSGVEDSSHQAPGWNAASTLSSPVPGSIAMPLELLKPKHLLGVDPFDGLGATLGGALSNAHGSQPMPPVPADLNKIPIVQREPPSAVPQTAAASATLFGLNTTLTGYDLSAPAAPKARVSGNPFA